jgi:hypothetical protein
MLFVPLFTCAQNIGPFIRIYNKKLVLKRLEKIIQKDSSLTVKYSLEEIGDTLFMIESTEKQTTKMKITFNLKDGYCDYQEIKTTCGECAEKRQADLFRFFKWYKISDSKYVSRFSRKMEVEIINNPLQEFCTCHIFRYNSMSKKEYKEAKQIYKSQNNLNN